MFDVAIIGCGPVGALAANLLGKRGLNVVVLEKEATPYPLPRAVHLDHEMVRLFQSIGLHDRILPDMRDTDGHLHIGADHGVIRYMGTVGKPRPYGWSNDYFFYQPELEEHLRNALTRFSNVSLRFGAECLSVTQQSDKVALQIRCNNNTDTLNARWVIACDGARSTVRKSLGIKLDDLEFEEPWLVVDAEVEGEIHFPELTGLPDDANIQQLSVMMCDPKRPATVVPGRGNHRRWELMLLPGEDDQAMMQPAKVTELLAPYLQGVPHKIVRAATYRFHGLVAEQWKSGNVFLAGDAAHQTPPFFGQGMCHGFRDVANLAWKLDLVAQEKASESLLDTYQPERDPHVRSVISAAVGAGRYICMLDEQKAAERDIEIRRKVKNGELPTTAADLIPPVAAGIIAKDTAEAGRRFIQPRVKVNGTEQLFDDLTRGDWRLLVANSDGANNALSDLKLWLPDLDIEVVDLNQLDDPQLNAWLEEAGVDTVLLRPDYYVYGTAKGSCKALLMQLRHQLDGKQNVTPTEEFIA
ncbi:bifunctional 3-(3-hydroxy-phenyl)propionate/3-hydroxycinnamic acid hydroxylase MhpA [Alteromonas gilva]|uniref:Bifunctional 3-(3-hydroxy-phenyl)propionate/3-hydroxycinnamic acid hydroxylase n=1 Tax=Alteromonas gilva TaxID=2987522 RepID=A0ABT5L949_9ALTE|nr:bifunctional 3-(3-hydroxy-phenyl)propionate/3-hydroxycinnamic acid hydroxylase [Alteromonas gilva]MDC8833061.1 bifunctional 3-(3-hydroxy-phenyl)propionate/3-hydroxycinnamic acid hydroxylase [Alteromonas gilva]